MCARVIGYLLNNVYVSPRMGVIKPMINDAISYYDSASIVTHRDIRHSRNWLEKRPNWPKKKGGRLWHSAELAPFSYRRPAVVILSVFHRVLGRFCLPAGTE